jgi:hydroxyacylglutathione hydrolase
MIVRRVTEPLIAQCAYIIACPRTGQAILIDPVRAVARYEAVAREVGVTIMLVMETHAPSDYISGVREMLLETACRAALSGETAPPAWCSARSAEWNARVSFLKGGDQLSLGDLTVTAVSTPGHADGALSYFISDTVRGVQVIATGDALLTGGAGRVDAGAIEELRDALTRLAALPDETIVLAGHTAGSACGAAVALPGETTLGIERRFNRAMRVIDDADAFALATRGKQPDRPAYFERVEAINHGDRAKLLRTLEPPREVSADTFVQLISMPNTAVIDTRPWARFSIDGAMGALHAPLDRYFASIVAPSVLPDERIVIVCARNALQSAVDALHLVGLDRIEGWIDEDAYSRIDETLLDYADVGEISQAKARARGLGGATLFLDVRTTAEWLRGRIQGARHMSLAQLPVHAREIDRATFVIAYCRTGARSARACAYLKRLGITCATLQGGYWPWFGRGYPVEGADQPF